MTDPTPWAPRLLRFRDRPAYHAALAAAGWPAPGDVPAEAAALVELGTLRAPGTEDAPGAPLPGWHVRALFAGAPPAALASAEVAEVAGAPVVPGLAGEETAPGGTVPEKVAIGALLFALRDAGWITHAEALSAGKTGDMPATLVQVLAQAVASGAITAAQAEDAELTWATLYEPQRVHPLWNLFLAAGVATAAQVDDLFRDAGAR